MFGQLNFSSKAAIIFAIKDRIRDKILTLLQINTALAETPKLGHKLQTFELPSLGLNARNIKVRRSISLVTDVDTGYIKMRRLADSNAAENKRVSARSLKALVELTGASKDCDSSKDWSKKVLRPSARQTHLLWREKFGLNVGIGTAALSMLIPRCGSNPRVTIGL